MLFGAGLAGKVLIVDDVISAGTSVNNSVAIIRQAGAVPAGVAVAMDRQERGEGPFSAVQETEQRHRVKVISIVTLDNVIEYLEGLRDMKTKLERISDYRKLYGVT